MHGGYVMSDLWERENTSVWLSSVQILICCKILSLTWSVCLMEWENTSVVVHARLKAHTLLTMFTTVWFCTATYHQNGTPAPSTRGGGGGGGGAKEHPISFCGNHGNILSDLRESLASSADEIYPIKNRDNYCRNTISRRGSVFDLNPWGPMFETIHGVGLPKLIRS